MSPLSVDLLNWLARLPFLAVDDLALLTGAPEPDIEAALRELAQAAQVEAITPSSPELDATRLFALTEPARRHIASGAQAADQTAALPLDTRDILHRLASLEATVALNVFAAGLVAALRRNLEAGLEDLWALPNKRPRDVWWPSGVHAFGALRTHSATTPFFVFVDRAGAPSAHRATLVAGWYRFREGPQPWGSAGCPPILILCPGPAQEDAWSLHVRASADRRRLPPLAVLLASRASLGGGPDGPHWRRADDSGRATLAERLGAGPATTTYFPPPPPRLVSCPDETTARAMPLHLWAQATLADGRKASRLERLAPLSLTTSAVEKRLLDCLGRHPLLTGADLATVLQLPARVVRTAVKRALKSELIAVSGATEHTPYYLSGTGLALLATRDQVPLRRYARHTSLTAPPGPHGGRLPTLLQQSEHTVGANSFFVGWLRRTPATAPRLVTWLNAAESAVRFESAGWRRWLRPDGSGTVIAGGCVQRFFLEWDRGTERLPVLALKLARYADFYQSCRARTEAPPALLLVTTTPQREELVRRVGRAAMGPSVDHLMTTTASLLERLGPFQAVWRCQDEEHRKRWPARASDHDDSLEVRR